MVWMFKFLLLQTAVCVSSFEIYYDCFGEFIRSNCSTSQQIYPLLVRVGSKDLSLNCPAIPGRNSTQFDQCCKPETGDQCVGDYANVDNPQETFTYHRNCIGKSDCTVQITRTDTAYLNCNQTAYSTQTSFMSMEYQCIDESKVAVLQASASQNLQSEVSDSIYLQGATYKTGNGIQSSISSSSCSIEAPYCNSTINIEVLDLRLAENVTFCKQNISIEDGTNSKILTCQDNINFTIYAVNTETNYITVNFLNSMSVDGGYFWLEFRGTYPETVELNCPAQPPSVVCNLTTTTEQPTTDTTELPSTPDLTTTEPDTTEMTSTPDLTTTEPDTTEMTSTPDLSTTEPDTTEMTSTPDLTTTEPDTTEMTSTPDLTTTEPDLDTTESTNNTTATAPSKTTQKPNDSGNIPWIAIGVAVPIVIVIVIVIIAAVYICKKNKSKEMDARTTTDRNGHLSANNEKGLEEEDNVKNEKAQRIEDSILPWGGEQKHIMPLEPIKRSEALEPITANESSQKVKKKKKKKKNDKKLMEMKEEELSRNEMTPENNVNVTSVLSNENITAISKLDVENSASIEIMDEENGHKKKKKKRKHHKHKNKVHDISETVQEREVPDRLQTDFAQDTHSVIIDNTGPESQHLAQQENVETESFKEEKRHKKSKKKKGKRKRKTEHIENEDCKVHLENIEGYEI